MRTEGGTRLVAFNLETRERKELLRGGAQPRYLPTGHLVYALDDTLQAVRFDAETLEVRSAPATVATDVMVNDNGTAVYGVAANGTLVYVPGTADSTPRRLAWVTRDGAETIVPAPPLNYVYPRLSPDDSQVALDVREPEGDIWAWDFDRKLLTRITFDPAENPVAVWSPDGRYLAFGDGRSGTANVYRQALHGGTLERLTESDRRQVPMAYTPDGSGLLFVEAQPEGGWDVFLLKLDGTRRIDPLLRGRASEINVEPSPDGRWIAYASDESGRFEIYVRSFPDVSRVSARISRDGGSKPLWSPDGSEIYFSSPDRKLMAARLSLEPQVQVREIAALFDAAPYMAPETGSGARPYDISSDGTRFLMLRLPDSQSGPRGEPRIVAVLDWADDVVRRAAGGGARRRLAYTSAPR
jgi:serine/threonine-protein kinase